MLISDDWPQTFQIAEREVHVWSVRAVAENSAASELAKTLSPDETARLARFRYDHLQRSYAISRGVLRLLLGRYLGIAPQHVSLTYGPMGKPHIGTSDRLKFNLSHSGKLTLLALTLGCEIGVDLELMRPMCDLLAIAERFFCPEEASQLVLLNPDEREHAFFACWTRKEAYIKARGDGLQIPLDSFRVTMGREELPKLIVPGNRSEETWSLHNIDSLPGYAAAISYRDARRAVRMFPTFSPIELIEMKKH